MSKIVSIDIKNFMSIGEATIEFDENNIISICGYNNVGKSAIRRSTEVMLYNAYSNEQANYIKDGEDYWHLKWTFDDGVVIDRYKYIDGKSVWEMYKGEVQLFTNRLGDSIASMQDIPEIISNYLGVIKDEHTGEQLNVRKNTDRLFLINTTGGDNYKILNSILKSDVLAEASKNLNEDKNKLQSKMQSLRTSCDTLKEEVATLSIAPKSMVDDVREGIKSLEHIKVKTEKVRSIKKAIDNYNDIVVYDELELVDLGKVNKLKEIKALAVESTVAVPPVLEEVDLSKVKKLAEIKTLAEQSKVVVPPELAVVDTMKVRKIAEIKGLINEVNVVVPPELDVIDLNKLKALQQIKTMISEYKAISTELEGVESSLLSVTAELKEFEKQGYKICSNCGSAVI